MQRGRHGASRPIRVAGLRLGHSTAPDGSTGVTVALFHPPAAVVVDVRGGASCTYDTASLSVEATFGHRWGLFFAGGSVHGLDAARGIRTALLSQGDGYRPFRNPNRIVQVSGATLFDLPSEEGPIVDYLPLGFEAVKESSPSRVAVGRVGAGAGATVGKYLGKARAMPGGLGYAADSTEVLGAAGALVVLNSVGAVRDSDSGRWLAGARGPGGRVVPPRTRGHGPVSAATGATRGTNLVLVVTEAPLDRSGLHRVAVQAHDGLARAVTPAHTATDGDVVFAATTGSKGHPPRESYPGATADRLGAQLATLVARAAVVAVRP
ncbi:MAG: P1 family peptidase [Thermoplasmata archaeon]|nr:P1 family peptidase [Thermoplasmata archaeon]